MFSRVGLTSLRALSLALLWVVGVACSDASMPTSQRNRFTQGGDSSVRNPSTSVEPREGDAGSSTTGAPKGPNAPKDSKTPTAPKEPKPTIPPPTTTPDPQTGGTTTQDAPVASGSGAIQSLTPVDVYCSGKTVSYNDGLDFENSTRVTLRFYNHKSSIFTWNGFLNTPALRERYLATGKLEIPSFAGSNLPDGQYDVLICEKDKLSTCFVDFANIFEFTPFEAVYYGQATGLIGTIRRANMVNGRFDSFTKLSLVHSATPASGTCTTEHE